MQLQPVHHKDNPRWALYRKPKKRRAMSIHLERWQDIVCAIQGGDYQPQPSTRLVFRVRDLFVELERFFHEVRHSPECDRKTPHCHRIKRQHSENCRHNLSGYNMFLLFILKFIADHDPEPLKSEAPKHYYVFESDVPVSARRRRRFTDLFVPMLRLAMWQPSPEYMAELESFGK